MAKSIYELVNEPWRRNIQWDVTHAEALRLVDDEMFAFDPELSYETTGYRPISETKGFDFDPQPFKEIGNNRVRTKRYTELHPGSRAHRDWWQHQHNLSDDGFVHNNYRITGDHYFFLNFYSMLVTQVGMKAGSGRNFTHPDFWSIHYEWFHYIELAEILGFDCAALKARGVGFSEVGACLGVRPFITTPDYSTVYLASYEPFLKGKGIVQKCWKQLDWLNQNTEGGMRRIRQAINQDLHKKASKLTKQGEEYGHMAQISGQVVDKADKLRGDRTERLIFEESGSNPVLLATYSVGEALVIINGVRLGTRIIFGTGGDSETSATSNSKSGLHGLEKMFLKPRTYRILPYRHKYNERGDYVETAFFVPSWRTVLTAMDHRGVVNEKNARAYYDKIRRSLQSEPEDYLKHCAEYCYTYEEALSRKGDNRFDQVKLAEQRVQIEILKTTPTVTRGYLKWIYEPGTTNRVAGIKFTPDPKGDIEITEEPIPDIPNLYVSGIDSIDVGTDESIVGKEGSKFCIVIKKRTYGMTGDQYVAKYLGRPSDVRYAYEKAMQLLYWYKAQANVEATKVSIIAYFREKGMASYLMKRPKYALEGQSGNKNASNLIGTQATPRMIEYGLDLIRDYIVDYCHTIYYADMVQQLQEYSDEMKGKYDIVAAMQMCEIADQELMGIVPRKEEAEEWDDIGFYKDHNGIKRHGIIPKQQNYDDILFPH